jgi:hypothetical protein
MHSSNSVGRVGRQLGELAIATPQVISHRLNRMASVGTWTPADLEDFHVMGSEKVAAFFESWQAIGRQATRFQQRAAEGLLTMLSQPWSTKLTPTWYAGHALRTFSTGLAPVHRRAVANARRLAKQ